MTGQAYPLVKNQEYDGVDAPRRFCTRLTQPVERGNRTMETICTIGLDIAKHAFQVHAATASGQVVLQKKLRRQQVLSFFSALPRCTVAMEACAGSHYWGREFERIGHR